MASRAKVAAATLVAAVVGVGLGVAYDPYLLVRAQFERQRLNAGLAEGEVSASGHRWTYSVANGAPRGAPTIVMIHGFTGSKENWYPLADQLRGRYRLLIPDLPGWGESERKADTDYGFVAQSERVADFIRKMSPNKPVVLLGHSMGGGIAALVAARHPELVAKVGLLNAAGVRFKDNQFGLDVLAGKNPFGVDDAASLQRYIDTVFHRQAAKPWIPWPASRGLIAMRKRDAAFEQAVLERIGRSDEALLPGEEATRIRQPALLLWCRQDVVIDSSALDLYAQRIPQARKVLLDECGHMSLMERPQQVADAVKDLVAASTPTR
ncbi:alpha/beta hydrolase [Thermomonas sp. HDW16]|uniref:alpha/beta fold hydrolase n=1 Tax=Thermomonas sp. HDW16 TaxID=2714945 RepID=UPI00140B32A6|nr:alpha/beta hydrolase [Thermomonas sp. HDW16]QIL19263.1 alpha/beta hydrolase [Thermomonas sp. HDW16]